MNFTAAIQSAPEIAQCLKKGIAGIRGNSTKVAVRETRHLKGSVDIDACLVNRYPNKPRWDYVFGYKDRVYYVEVHPADNTGTVKEVTAKLQWLKQWRKLSAKNLDSLKSQSTYHWISTGKTAFKRQKR